MDENTRTGLTGIDRYLDPSTDRSFANFDDRSVTPPLVGPLRRAPALVSQPAKSSNEKWGGRLYNVRSFRLPSYGRFSQKFVSKSWYRASFLAIICITMALALGIGLKTAVGGSHEPLRVLGLDGQSPREGLFLYGGIRIWDMGTKTLSIRWMPHQCGPSYDAPTDCTGLRSDMLFFTNGHALGIPSFDESNVALNFTADWQGFLKYGFEQSLDMDAPEGTRSGQINLFGSESDDLYPFDWYRIQYLVAAVSPATNQTVPIVGASIFNPDQSQWKAYTEYIYLDNLNGQATKLTVFITMKRRVIVKIAAFLILIFNWLVTATLLHMTVVNVLGRREPPKGMDVVALSFAGLFALPSVRSVMPGNPPFGCLIDFIGILPNLAIISGCAASLLISRLHREPRELYPPHAGAHPSPKSTSNDDLEEEIPSSESTRGW